MKTRTLLLLALGCGLAIMIAGAVFLVQLATQDDPEPPAAIGVDVAVGDMTVVVRSSSERDGVLTVDVAIGGTDDDAPADEFRLVASGRPERVVSSTCPAISGSERVDCSVVFDVSSADGVSRVLVYERGDFRARWVLA